MGERTQEPSTLDGMRTALEAVGVLRWTVEQAEWSVRLVVGVGEAERARAAVEPLLSPLVRIDVEEVPHG